MSALRKLTIDRSRWIRGIGCVGSFLLRGTDGHMCCLGFLARELGASPEDVSDAPCPTDAPLAFTDAPWLFSRTREGAQAHSEDGRFLINTNDDMFVSGPTRERRIAQVFKQHGWELEFVDGPVTP